MVNKRIYTQITQMAHRFIIVFFSVRKIITIFPFPLKILRQKLSHLSKRTLWVSKMIKIRQAVSYLNRLNAILTSH